MAISHPIVAEIARGVYCINEFGMDSLFLITGTERALLVDTGTGVFDLPAFLKTLTPLPVDVALTHGHVDHAGGMGCFDRVYLHPADFTGALSVTPETRRDFAGQILQMAGGIFACTPDDVRIYETRPELLPLKEGDVFDLGGVHVDVYETPGHTPGGLSFLIREERILLSGDACNPNTLLFPFLPDGSRAPHASLEGLEATARKIQALSPLYDRNYNGHIGFGGEIAFLPLPESLPQEVADLCRDLISGKATWEAGGQIGLSAVGRFPHGRVCFDPAHCREGQ